MSEWQPIETAPRDGSEIIILLDHAVSAQWIEAKEGYVGYGWVTLESREGYYKQNVPRGWIPMPTPPQR